MKAFILLAALIQITSGNFKEEVQDSKTPVVLDFSAKWCGPCQETKKILEELQGEYGDKVKFVTLDIDDEKEITDKFRVKDLPTLIFIKEGKIKGIQQGFADKETIKTKISESF